MFSSLGITQNQFPDPYKKPRYSGNLLILGGARCVWDDLSQVDQSKDYHAMCVNDIVMHYPYDVHHAYSNDDKMLHNWVAARRPRYNMEQTFPILKHTCQKGEGYIVWPFPGHGSSGLNAVYVGLALGYEKIILCGVPLDNSGHYFDPLWIKTKFEREVPEKDAGIRYWSNARDNIFQGKVISMSGRIKDLLGEPNVKNVSTF